MRKKIKVVWICHFSNSEIREHLHFTSHYLLNHLRKFLGRPQPGNSDFAIWVTNGLREINKYDDIELHVILPYRGLKPHRQVFIIQQVHYYCYRPENDFLLPFVKDKIFRFNNCKYPQNRRYIKSIIQNIQPDVIHLIGAENPYYSIAALDFPKNIPSIVSLQTLISPPDFLKKSPQYSNNYLYRVEIEQKVIQTCSFIGTTLSPFMDYISSHIKPDAQYLPLVLPIGVDVDMDKYDKEYDFVYFAQNIKKACDLAIEAFALVCRKFPNASLNVSGSYDSETKNQLDKRLRELGIHNNVFFTGSKATHQAVLTQIKKSRFALLPLKVDFVSSTIREAMACGLPVVSTITDGTPELNEERESLLLSPIGDIYGMAHNMLRLMTDDVFAETIRKNAFITVRERYSNEAFIAKWHDAYMNLAHRID